MLGQKTYIIIKTSHMKEIKKAGYNLIDIWEYDYKKKKE